MHTAQRIWDFDALTLFRLGGGGGGAFRTPPPAKS